MKLYDTHAHFSADMDCAAVLKRAKDAHVVRIMAVGGSPELNGAAITAQQASPDSVRLALGWDRDQTGTGAARYPASLKDALLSRKCAAIGEIGLDFHYAPDSAKEQEKLFAAQLALADELSLPVVIHTRDADDSTLGVLDEVPWRHDTPRGIIHCFTGSVPFERKLLDRNFFISISGIVTFRAAENVRDAARLVPDDRLLIETDSPFLAPVPLRGRANEPAFMAHTAAFLASLRGVPVERLAEITYSNAVSLLG